MVCQTVDLRVVWKCKWLHKCILVHFIFDRVLSKMHEDGLTKTLSLEVRLWMIQCCCENFNTEEGPHSSKEFAAKLRTIVTEDIHCDVVKYDSITIENIQNVRGRFIGEWDSSRQLEVSVGSDKYIQVILC